MIVNIQYLRFIAAFSVIIAHAALQMYGVDAQITNAFGVGVDIFFVISGFIMPFIIYGGYYHHGLEPKYSPLAFMKKRIIRIWPLFFIATSSVLA
ncbi:acyltransferase family protein, partial [Aeromonas veronii]